MKIEIQGAVGDEVTLVHGDNTLVVKLDKDAIVPDVVEATMRAINANPDVVSMVAQNIYHHLMNSQTHGRQALAVIRDRVFKSIKPEKGEEDEARVVGEAKKEPKLQSGESVKAPKKTTRKARSTKAGGTDGGTNGGASE